MIFLIAKYDISYDTFARYHVTLGIPNSLIVNFVAQIFANFTRYVFFLKKKNLKNDTFFHMSLNFYLHKSSGFYV